MIDSQEWVSRLVDDGEFMMAARGWTGGLRVETSDGLTGFTVTAGQPSAKVPDVGDGVIALEAPSEVWSQMTAQTPPPFLNDLSASLSQGVRRRADAALAHPSTPGDP